MKISTEGEQVSVSLTVSGEFAGGVTAEVISPDGEKDDALQTHIPGLWIKPRAGTPWQGDWASSFGWHRFEDLPTEGVVNFAFAGLTPEHVIDGFARVILHSMYMRVCS